MYHPEYSAVLPNGTVTYRGPLELNKGNHTHMPSRTAAYLPGEDERGHVNASSLGGCNTVLNVVPQHRDLNHHAYYAMERGERNALKQGAEIMSEKTAVVNGQPGDRPNTFVVNDTVTYADGQTQQIHHSFVNEAYADQQAWNDASAALPGTFDAPNPGDGLREAVGSPEAYADLMERTDAELPGIAADYAPAEFSGVPDAEMAAEEAVQTADAGVETDAQAEDGVDADAESDERG